MQEGQALLRAAVSYLQQSDAAVARVGFLFNPRQADSSPGPLALALHAAMHLPSRRAKIAGFLDAMLAQVDSSTSEGDVLTDPVANLILQQRTQCRGRSCLKTMAADRWD